MEAKYLHVSYVPLGAKFRAKKLPTEGKFLQSSFLHVAKFLHTGSKFLREGGKFLFGIKVLRERSFCSGAKFPEEHISTGEKFLREQSFFGGKVRIGEESS
jgi:hypothetical protein